MTLTVNNISMPIDSTPEDAKAEAVRRCGIEKEKITGVHIKKRSVDARRGTVNFVYSVLIEYGPAEEKTKTPVFGTKKQEHGIVVIGSGPAGLFCAYTLAQNGYAPLLLERGADMSRRTADVAGFYSGGNLNENSNIQFGEGGAGTFSDGKLTTRVNDERCDTVLRIFVDNGAKDEILYDSKPHVGTDMLKDIVVSMRKTIIKNGGEVRFNTAVTDIKTENGKLRAVVADGCEIPCDKAVFAVGHSARDTYEMLYSKGAAMTPKAFAMGYRIEHKREFIDAAQYGKFAGHKNLGAADYRLTYNEPGRSCFSFCMCPGGFVVAAASEQGGIAVNGMSENSRNGENSNSAIVAQITPEDFDGIFGGMELQRKCERAAYDITGSYTAPAQNSADFINGVKSTRLLHVKPTYPLGCEPWSLEGLLPKSAGAVIVRGLKSFDRKIKGFSENGVLTGVETRTSAPVRILRNENMESITIKNLMPIGEGAGYAGGIMSAAVDGIKAACNIMSEFCLRC